MLASPSSTLIRQKMPVKVAGIIYSVPLNAAPSSLLLCQPLSAFVTIISLGLTCEKELAGGKEAVLREGDLKEKVCHQSQLPFWAAVSRQRRYPITLSIC